MNYNTISPVLLTVRTMAATASLATNSTESAGDAIAVYPFDKRDSDLEAIISTTSQPDYTSPYDRYSEIRENVVLWSIIDGLLFITIVCGNCLTIAAVQLSRRLRSVVSNLFILSLAISDLLVGLTIPYHLAFYLDVTLGESHFVCIMKFFFNIVACCVSIWNLIAIAIDRYIAIVYPLHYSRWITKRVAITVIMFGWISGTLLGGIPLFWNNFHTSTECEFDEVLPPWYMAGIVTPVFSLIWLCMLTLYWRIWREAYKHAKQLRASISGLHEGGHSDWKSVQVVILILGCFTICWLPYFVVVCSQIFHFAANSSPIYYKAAFSLAMANSGMNPVIYAWKNRTFRRAFTHLLRCRTPDSHALIDDENARQNMKRKSSSLAPSLSAPPPTPNSVISATPPPINYPDSYHHRSSLHRYHHGFTAFPLPPPPPSPQSPVQEPMETIVIAPNVKCVFDSPNEADTDIENNNDEQLNNHLYLHPSINRWQSFSKNHHIIMDDDILKTEFKNFNNNELYLHRLTTTSPADSVVSAPLTPTGNLIVNILGNLENHSNTTNIMNRKNYRNSTNCVIGRNSMDGTNTPIAIHNSKNKLPTVALAEQRFNGHTKTIPIPITSKTSPNGTVQCVTISINNNDTIGQGDDQHQHYNSIKSNNLYCYRGYSLSSSAPQSINFWSGPT
ncbi:beta-2 adrenergic receptor [Contarinia nasturtii]|uniref:beta-2 adrenergic receptor n=1 Tax=Contarinia nasturtii TaxID=265458 RepID=UPI0012D4988B|nr:beta-2 adrenergic receptor [Contarinia nasturtii]